MGCQGWEEKLLLYLYDELGEEARAATQAHLGSCAVCPGRLQEMRRLQERLRERPAAELPPDLLVRCRQALDEALDQEALGWRGWWRSWGSPVSGTAPSRAGAVLTLFALGFGLGWMLRPPSGGVLPSPSPAVPGSFLEADLSNLRISGITRIAPSPQTGAVRITLDAARRVTLEGSLDDARIRQVLLYAVKSYDNPGIRRDTLDALRTESDSPEVQEALLYALRKDPNVGIRLEALEAVRGMGWGPEVRETLLYALRSDSNPGVRVAALNLLAENPDEEVLPVLKQLASRDPNPYVRLKCASAVREWAREEF